MTPDNAQPPVTAQRVREIGLAHITACCPDPKYACGNCTRETAELNAVADQLEQHERELAAVKVRAYSFPWPVFAKTYVEMIEEELAELRRDRKRLDWLENNRGNICCFTLDDPAFFIPHEQDGGPILFARGDTVREAIDAALAAHKPEASKEDGA